MRTTEKLTERQIKALKPRERPYKAADGAGLYLYVTRPEASCGASSTASRAR